jgi:hypothetical protein
MPKTTPEQLFAKIFTQFTSGAIPEVRAEAEKKMDAWLSRKDARRHSVDLGSSGSR